MILECTAHISERDLETVSQWFGAKVYSRTKYPLECKYHHIQVYNVHKSGDKDSWKITVC